MGPLFQILSESPSERKKGASMAVAPVIAMLAPFLKSADVDLDGGRNGSPNLLPASFVRSRWKKRKQQQPPLAPAQTTSSESQPEQEHALRKSTMTRPSQQRQVGVPK